MQSSQLKPRQDLYLKMVGQDPSAPTEEEIRGQAVSKERCVRRSRWMVKLNL